jgi:hypothetical protein
MLLGSHSLAASLQLQLLWVYLVNGSVVYLLIKLYCAGAVKNIGAGGNDLIAWL